MFHLSCEKGALEIDLISMDVSCLRMCYSSLGEKTGELFTRMI